MKPRICQIKDDPPNSYGDCIRACVATLLDNDEVPHVFDGRPPLEAWRELRAWLATINKTIAVFPSDDHVGLMRENNPGVPYILMHSTGRADHAVICRNGEKIHDPAWYRCGIEGPLSIGFYVICIIGDLV